MEETRGYHASRFFRMLPDGCMLEVKKSAVLVEFFAVLPRKSASTADFFMLLRSAEVRRRFGKAQTSLAFLSPYTNFVGVYFDLYENIPKNTTLDACFGMGNHGFGSLRL